MQEAATAHVKEKLAYGIVELSQGPYRSRYFLVAKKKPDEYHFINDVQPLNKVTIRDSGMPPSVDEFSEDFAGYPIVTRSITTPATIRSLSIWIPATTLPSYLTSVSFV